MKNISLVLISISLFSFTLIACTDVEENGAEIEQEIDAEADLSASEEIIKEEDVEVDSPEIQEVKEKDDDSEADGIDHHDELPYEWAGTYQLDKGTYSLVFNENEFGDESILVAFLLENKNIHDLEHHAAHLFEAIPEEINDNHHFIAKHEFIYNLPLNSDATQFTFEVDEAGSYVLFTEHHAHEFQMQIWGEDGTEIIVVHEKEYEGHGHSHDH